MKYQTTKKEILNHYNNIISVGYCKLQYLLHDINENAYTCGVYGWNADIYEIPEKNTVIVTGYRPFGKSANYEIVKKYDEIGKKLQQEYYKNYNYEELKENSKKELLNFISEVLGV